MPGEGHQDTVLRAICSIAKEDPANTVVCRSLVEELGMMHFQLYRAVLALEGEGYLEYLGAGPTVRLTATGVERCRALRRGAD